jgi:hypothetical protein
MIIELVWFEPEGGRQYEGPWGGEISAIERLRIDCLECHYTKMKIGPEDNIWDIVRDSVYWTMWHNTSQIHPDHNFDHKKFQWCEFIVLQYRCLDNETRLILAPDCTLFLYGTQQRGIQQNPDRLDAKLGPRLLLEDEEDK